MIDLKLSSYDYHLPEEFIAQKPVPGREGSRLMLLDRADGTIAHSRFSNLPGLLRNGDLLVVNDTRVVPARLHGRKESGGRVELLVLEPYKDPEKGRAEGYRCLVKSSKKPRIGATILLAGGRRAEIAGPIEEGEALVRFPGAESLLEMLTEVGETPLPPYIHRERGGWPEDAALYQTVYADKAGAVAAPTAGLHFTPALLDELAAAGIERAQLTLHVGVGTFSPIRVDDARDHVMHPEYLEVPPETAKQVERARNEGRRVVAVGTTVVRSLEWAALEDGRPRAVKGLCNHYIYPGYHFRVIDAMITNFHLPKSSLLLLVSAFAGRESILNAYEEAIRQGYRFHSYGDAMLIG